MIEAIEIFRAVRTQTIKAKDLMPGQFFYRQARPHRVRYVKALEDCDRLQVECDNGLAFHYFNPDDEVEVIAKCALKRGPND